MTPKNYGPNEVKIRHYPKYNNMYTAGSKIRIYAQKLIGIKDNQIVPIEDPESQPYLLISTQRSKYAISWFYAVTEENYYPVNQYFYPMKQSYFHKIEDNSKHPKLTEMHREVVKKVINDYLKEKLSKTDINS